MTAAARLATALTVVFALAGCGSSEQPTQRRMDAAQDVFKNFVDLGNAYDPRVAELYDDDADVILLRPNEPPDRREVVIGGREFRQLLRKTLPRLAKAGKKNRFSDVNYAREDDGVRIDATRKSLPDGVETPHQLLIAPSEDGVWRIQREVATTQ